MKIVHAPAVVGLLVAVMLLGPSSNVWAQWLGEGNSDRTYGTVSSVSHIVPARAFLGGTPSDDANMFTADNRGRYCTLNGGGGTTCRPEAGVFLPSGAVVTQLEFDACLVGTGQIEVLLTRHVRHSLGFGGATLVAVKTSTFDLGAPPLCTNFPQPADAGGHRQRQVSLYPRGVFPERRHARPRCEHHAEWCAP